MGRLKNYWRSDVEESLVLPIKKLKQWKYLNKPFSGTITWKNHLNHESKISFMTMINDNPSWIRLMYSISREGYQKKEFDYKVFLEKSKCNYGGYRFWFKCPNLNCQKRCLKLYKPDEKNYFCCRKCSGLIYEQQRDSKRYRNAYIFRYKEKLKRINKEIKRTSYRGKKTKKVLRKINLTHKLHIANLRFYFEIMKLNRSFKNK